MICDAIRSLTIYSYMLIVYCHCTIEVQYLSYRYWQIQIRRDTKKLKFVEERHEQNRKCRINCSVFDSQ